MDDFIEEAREEGMVCVLRGGESDMMAVYAPNGELVGTARDVGGVVAFYEAEE